MHLKSTQNLIEINVVFRNLKGRSQSFSAELLMMSFTSRLMLFQHSSEYVWLCRDWARTKIFVYGDKETFDNLSAKCIFVSNHRGDLDWVLCYAIAADYNVLHVRFSLSSRERESERYTYTTL